MQKHQGFLEHRYGEQVRILDNPAANGLLAELCHPETFQPRITHLVETLYSFLIPQVLAGEFPVVSQKSPTRMTASHPEAFCEGTVIDRSQRAVTVNLARAGTLPSQICYNWLNSFLNPAGVRQDHILAARTVDTADKVTGAEFTGTKIGGTIQDAIVLFPDPMAATGSTLRSILDLYKTRVEGTAKKFVALHMIVTPEYLRNLTRNHPDLVIYALRLDRGLSPQSVLSTIPGTHWEQEKGLNEKQYIVPGGGGFGEIMNNSFV